ncbi:15-hydroxyprostaglandin dehydrogenase [Eumeta japonica]|uniref:15-hydroxyprostaglandin dehydrogenase n=1 Tax=Eumeta variegata TaxID=151549 RepID=A0A4C2ABS0_EUMVA|nr:15-hydroxyprostaglandin dehydrogenase [Eumeta japonica]
MGERSVRGKVVLITGGAEGIGREIARNYLAAGAGVVVLVDVNDRLGRATAAELNSTHGPGKASFIQADVTSEKDLDAVYARVLRDYDHLDVLVNNAGVLDESNWKKCIDINLTSLIGWSFKYLEHMRKDRGGRGGTIVNLASIYGFRIDQYLPVYQASKFGVLAFTRSLGHSYNYDRTGVRVIAICPSFTKTALTDRGFSCEFGDEMLFADFKSFLETEALWQNVDAVGGAAVEVFERADSGTGWVIEGAKPVTPVPE